ncbi:hypothetical protein AUJ64_02470 [Candidatus Pacearchaeota archaeon CG1_02_39_14]|nr:MAG: hypothetical protein AUJ64_02470 [Candidatus Pacearchaeota archaeon CG1_02_39_14]
MEKLTTSELKRPKCSLIGTDGNVFALISKVSTTLKKIGQHNQAKEMTSRCFKAGSYDEALMIMDEYVEIT